MNNEIIRELITTALETRKRSYSPYSKYAVGAAVLAESGSLYCGCNIENASYGATVCAERVAIFAAVAAGEEKIKAVAVVGGPADVRDVMPDEASPCGICRQVMREFGDPAEMEIIIAKSINDYRIFKLAELLPESFGPENL
ncbi:MAG: cytidine deaminase [Lachnospiraceae bacterium]|nr:cytidine deaminase [Lachnospiraceae bacterium]